MSAQADSAQAELDRPVLLERLQSILSELHQEVTAHLPVTPTTDPAMEQFSSTDGQVTGSLQTASGEAIDWLVYSWLNAAPINFSTMRLSLWLGSQIQVPHLVFEFGTVPHLFFYMDYIPRVDMWTDLSYPERYYEPVQPTYLELRNNPALSLFVSKALYIRQFQSPVQLCFTATSTEASLELIRQTAHQFCNRWLTWIEQADPVPVECQTALAQRDRRMRRISAERDPGNVAVVRLFGDEFAGRLVRSLWGSE